MVNDQFDLEHSIVESGIAGAKDLEILELPLAQRVERFFTSPQVVRAAMYGVIAVLSVFLLLLFYIFSVALDKKLHERAVETLEAGGAEIAGGN